MTARYPAVAFDFDGTLFRTMENHFKAYGHIFDRFGVTVTWRDVCLREGKRAEEVIASLLENNGLADKKPMAAALSKEKGEFFRSLPPPTWYPGGEALIRDLHAAGVRLALVTGTTRPNIAHLLGDGVDLFEAVVSAENVTHSKPHPEPYLAAFGQLETDPARCAVVENAPLGITSGRAAGATVIAVPNTLQGEDLDEAHLILPDLNAVRTHLLGG